MSVLIWFGVIMAGGVGATARYLLEGAITRRLGSPFPVGTMVVNVSGSALLGLLAGLAMPDQLALVVGTGAVGSYTTFSTWMLETQRLGEQRQKWYAAVNVVASVVVGLGAAAVGQWLAWLG